MDKTRMYIDLHCDTLSECHKHQVGLTAGRLHLSLDRLPESHRLCQAFAIFMPDHLRGSAAEAYFEQVYQVFREQLALHGDRIQEVTDLGGIGKVLENRQYGAILTVEGGSALAGKRERVSLLREKGVRMMTLTWNGENEICGGCQSENGFTPFGRDIVAEMERVGMIVDVSHLSDAGFWELCDFAARPFVASHSNSRAVCGNPRNLTDEMFREIVRRKGLVGINYFVRFIKEDGQDVQMEHLLTHIRHFLALGGEDALALGSDFDGADMPPFMSGAEKLVFLRENMIQSGISPQQADKILYQNAAKFFRNFS